MATTSFSPHPDLTGSFHLASPSDLHSAHEEQSQQQQHQQQQQQQPQHPHQQHQSEHSHQSHRNAHPAATITQLRQSLSRSPSRPSYHRLHSTKSRSRSSKHHSFVSSPLSPSRRAQFATPENYRLVKPLPSAFMSTGLISKKNKHLEESNEGKNMPDTPCKRSSVVFADVPPKQFSQSLNPAKLRTTRASFGKTLASTSGSPGTPQSGPFSKARTNTPGSFLRSRLSKKSSFLNSDGENRPLPQSPSANVSNPPVDTGSHVASPTKEPTETENNQVEATYRSPRLASVNNSPHSFSSPKSATRQSLPISPSSQTQGEESDNAIEDSPSFCGLRSKSPAQNRQSLASFSRSRLLQQSNLLASPLQKRSSMSSPQTDQPAQALSTFSPIKCKLSRAVTPQTPQDHHNQYRHDSSNLSANNQPTEPSSVGYLRFPATPTGSSESCGHQRKASSLSKSTHDTSELDAQLLARFDKVELVGIGEFSQVYRVTQFSDPATPSRSQAALGSSFSAPSSDIEKGKIFAVKRSKTRFTGAKGRERSYREVDVLKALGQFDHVISYADSWEDNGYLYIQTEYCENGGLENFLSHVGLKGRLDDFRIWKILLELALGLKHIHDAGFIHLDVKPANVLVSSAGSLKIADFGMACRWPADEGIDGEGDREYMGPEILMGRYDKPADIFALGLMIFETAGNVELPDNGVSWQKLRNADMSDIPSLTVGLSGSLVRDDEGNSISDSSGSGSGSGPVGGLLLLPLEDQFQSPSVSAAGQTASQQSQSSFPPPSAPSATLIPSHDQRGQLSSPPDFMTDASNASSLDNVVLSMISPDPNKRPTADELLHNTGVTWVDRRRRAGATVYEGNWGPADDG